MAFSGCEFSFDGISSREFGLIIYNLGNNQQDDTFSFSSVGEVVEDRIVHRLSPLFYGLRQNKPIEFKLVFGLADGQIDSGKPIDRWDQEIIASWLTDRDGYKWFDIEQEDMLEFRFKAVITELRSISIGMNQWGYQCKVTCDSPYAYMYPIEKTYVLKGKPQSTIFFNQSTCNQFYFPKITLEMNGGTEISIINHTDANREFKFLELPTPSLRKMNTTYFLNLVADNTFRIPDAQPLPEKYYMGFSSTVPNQDGTGVTEPIAEGNGYSRVEISNLVKAVDGRITNSEDIVFPESVTAWGAMLYSVVYDSLTDGNLLWYDELPNVKNIGVDDQPVVRTGKLDLSIKNDEPASA